MDDIRHVIALDDPSSGTTRDHIIKHAFAAGPYIERPSWSKLPRFSRYVSGMNTEIPWPKEEEPQVETGKWDTLLEEVDQPSWIPSLFDSPFPSSVLDELRGKYSRFRTRHEPEYVRQKVLEEYRQEYLKNQRLLTPKEELKQVRIAKLAEKREASLDEYGNRKMSKETLEFIQDYMIESKAQTKKPTASH